MAKSYKSLAPKKSLGQNFLVDPHWIQAITDAFGFGSGDRVLEIGPGKGVLTERLLETAAELTAVEIDQRMVEHLQERFAGAPNLRLVHADFLRYDLSREFAGTAVRIVGNLPYHVTSSILMRVLDEVRRHHEEPAAAAQVADFAVMIQREVAQRILSGHDCKAYGILSVFVSIFFDGETLIEVPPTAFFPRPKVTSRVIRLRPLPVPRHPVADWAVFRRVVRGAFNQRRKMMRRSLAALPGLPPVETVPGAERWLTSRPEQLTPGDFAELAAFFADAIAAGAPVVGTGASGDRDRRPSEEVS